MPWIKVKFSVLFDLQCCCFYAQFNYDSAVHRFHMR